MKSTLKFFVLLVMVLSLVKSCKKEDDENPNKKVIEHFEDVISNETWSNTNIHLVTNFIAIKNATLTIEAGTIVRFKETAGLGFGEEETQMSKLIAKGKKGQEIKFVSERAENTNPKWVGLYFGKYNSRESVMEYCIIEDAGGEGSYFENGAVILDEKTSINFNNNVVKNSKGYGMYLEEDCLFNSFTGNTITNSAKSSIYMPTQWAHTIGTGNQIDNDEYGIVLIGNFSHKNEIKHWLKQTCPYTLDVDINTFNGSKEGCTLVIDAGNIIQMAPSAQFFIGNDDRTMTLIAKGTPSEPIIFKPRTPTGSWRYMWFDKGTAQDCLLEHCEFIRGGGDNGYGTIVTETLLDKTPTIRNCTIKQSLGAGIFIMNDTNNGRPVIENVTFIDCEGADVEYLYE